jgi:hypothetical protein
MTNISVPTVSDLRLKQGVTGDTVTTLGYYKIGDGGNTAYYCDNEVELKDNGGTVIDGDGYTKWIMLNQREISVLQFGAKGDGVQDDFPFIQPIFDIAAVPSTPTFKILFPPGKTYIITDSLYLGRAYNGTFTQTHGIELTSGLERVGYLGGTPAMIKTTFNDRPAIILQKCKMITIKGLMISGQNTFPWPTMDELLDDDHFIFNGARDGQYSPHAGICTDPYGALGKGEIDVINPRSIKTPQATQWSIYYPSNLIRGPGIPEGSTVLEVKNNELIIDKDVTETKSDVPLNSPFIEYPGERHAERNNNFQTGGGARITIKGCRIDSFVVGIMINPHPKNQNAEDVVIEECHLQINREHVAFGQSQSRNCSLRDNYYAAGRIITAGMLYGQKSGGIPNFFGGDAVHMRTLISGDTQRAGGNISGLYAEGFHTIGYIGGHYFGINFEGCVFKALNGGTKGNYYTPDHFFLTVGPTAFTGCTFTSEGGINAKKFYTDAGRIDARVAFTNCHFGQSNSFSPVVVNDIRRVKFSDCKMINSNETLGGAAIITDGIVFEDWYELSKSRGLGFNIYVQPGGTITMNGMTYTVEYYSPLVYTGNLQNPVLDLEKSHLTFGLDPKYEGIIRKGDPLINFHTNSWVKKDVAYGAIPGNTNLCIGVITDENELKAEVVPKNFSIEELGKFGYGIFVWRKLRYPTYGDLVAGSDQITNVVPPLSKQYWRIGDRIRDRERSLYDGTYIKSLDLKNNTIVLSKTAKKTQEAIDLFDLPIKPITKKYLGRMTIHREEVEIPHGLGYRPFNVEIQMQNFGKVVLNSSDDTYIRLIANRRYREVDIYVS